MAEFEKGIHTATVQEGANLSFGLGGFDYITGTATNTTFSYCAIKAVGADAVVTVVSEIGDSLTNFTITQDDYLFVPFTSVARVSGGNLLAYRYTTQ